MDNNVESPENPENVPDLALRVNSGQQELSINRSFLDEKLRFQDQGWVIVSALISEGDRDLIKDEMIRSTLDLIFVKRGFPLDVDNPENLRLLTNPKLRREVLPNPKMIWRNNNPRDPLVGKSTGMIPIYFNSFILEKVTFNPKFYHLLSVLYGRVFHIGSEIKLLPYPFLAHLRGPERFSIKAMGASQMIKHIDANPFYPEVNYPARIQTLYCVQVDTQIETEKSGTIVILENFNHYFSHFGNIFHPSTGLEGLKFPDIRSSFVPLPKNFDSYCLPLFNQLMAKYTDYYYHNILPESIEQQRRFREMKNKGYFVPKVFQLIKWKGIFLRPGDTFCWSHFLPHYTCPNKSTIPRMVCYYSIYPVFNQSQQTNFDYSDRCQKVRNIFWNRIISPTSKSDNHKNPEEQNILTNSSNLEDYHSYIQNDPLRSRLACLNQWV